MAVHTKLGRYAAPEPPSALARLHFHHPTVTLKTVDHEPKIAVLDQEDLLKQGIHCSSFITGAGDPDALGSCTANATISMLSSALSSEQFCGVISKLVPRTVLAPAKVYSDTVQAEKAAISFYHRCTDQTADTATEWPPTDCGSSGPYIYQYARRAGFISGEQIAHGAQNIASLLQADGLLLGTPWFNSWFQPSGTSAFVDGNGSVSALQAAINSGVAGGHEIYVSAIEKITVLPTGHIDPTTTVLRLRNSWSRTWGDQGNFRMHLSTLAYLGGQVDLRQFKAPSTGGLHI